MKYEYNLEFPDLRFIKSHPRYPNPRDKEEFAEYEWIIFDFGNAYCRIKYNEDDNGKLFLDMMVNGYSDAWNLPGFGITYLANAQGYKELQRVCLETYNRIIRKTLNSNEIHKTYWE